MRWTSAAGRGRSVDVTAGGIVVEAAYDGFDDLWDPLTSGVGPSGAFVAGLDDAGRGALRGALHRRLGAPEHPFELRARAWFARGRVPDA